jgi:hypothetical protein
MGEERWDALLPSDAQTALLGAASESYGARAHRDTLERENPQLAFGPLSGRKSILKRKSAPQQFNYAREGEKSALEKAHPSNYRGVSWDKSRNKWVAEMQYDGKRHYLGHFEDEKEAARAYDRAARAQHGEKAQLNFPAEGESGVRQSSKRSKYRGVSWNKSRNKWVAAIQYDGKTHYLGGFEDEKEAARAYDRAARAQHGEKVQVNFHAEGESGARQSSKRSKYRGGGDGGHSSSASNSSDSCGGGDDGGYGNYGGDAAWACAVCTFSHTGVFRRYLTCAVCGAARSQRQYARAGRDR